MNNCEKCKKEFPNWIKINNKRKNLQSRKYCLDCSPFGQHNTKNLTNTIISKDVSKCPKCKKIINIENFYKRRNNTGLSPYCKKCTNSQTLKRQRNLKEKAVLYKGGKCENCGYCKCIGALEFHHTNPKEKEFSLSQIRSTSWNNKIEEELKKCLLLCANCHRETHENINKNKLNL